MHKSLLGIAIAALWVSGIGAAEKCQINKLPPNPECPARGAGRIGSGDFIKRYASQDWELADTHSVPNSDFGIARPGERFGNSWVVAAKGEKIGINHKSAPWAKAEVICKSADGAREMRLAPDRGCGCGGSSDWSWTVPYSAPPGKHSVQVTWSWPQKTEQKLERSYTVTIENPHYGKTADVEIARLLEQHGASKVVVLQDGRHVNGAEYNGTREMDLACGGYENAKTGIISPRDRQLDIGYIVVNQGSSHYGRGLLAFDLTPLQGKRVKQAILKLTIRPGQSYRPAKMSRPMPIYPMLKAWTEGEKHAYHVDKRNLSPGMPNVYYQAYPTTWEKPLASGASDRGAQAATLEPEDGVNLLHGARADLTGLVNAWLEGKLPNHGMIIGADLPDELVGVHPGKGGKIEAFKKLYDGGLVPFFSSDEPNDADFRPRLIVVTE